MFKFIQKLKSNEKVIHPYDRFVRFFFPVIPKWIRPNHLSAARMIGVPFLVYLLWNNFYVASLILFILLALTDMFDGGLARGRSQITDIGIVLDPIADKLLIGTTVTILLLKVNLILALIVVSLEVLVMVLGLIRTALTRAVDLEANLWGKLKMNLQVAGVALLFLGLIINDQSVVSFAQNTFWVSSGLALVNIFSRVA